MINETPLIIIAAGRSTRMGFPKGLFELNGKTLLEHHLLSFRKVATTPVYLILGEHESFYRKEIGKILSNFKIIKNVNIERGQLFSVQLGIAEVVKEGFKSCFFTPVDVIPPSRNVWLDLKKEKEEEKVRHPFKEKEEKVRHPFKGFFKFSVSIPTFKGRGGHPLYITDSFMQNLLNVDYFKDRDDYRLDFQIRKLEESLVNRVPVEDCNILSNINSI